MSAFDAAADPLGSEINRENLPALGDEIGVSGLLTQRVKSAAPPHGDFGVHFTCNVSVSLAPHRRSTESRKRVCEKFHKVLASLRRAGFSDDPLAWEICHLVDFFFPVPCAPAAQVFGCESAYFWT